MISTVNSYHEFFKAFIFLTVLINIALDFRGHIGDMKVFKLCCYLLKQNGRKFCSCQTVGRAMEKCVH